MKNLVPCGVAVVLLMVSAGAFAQTSHPQATATETPKAKPDRGSEGAITMEEYETLLKDFQVKNPGKTFQNLSKEEFETYLTTELTRLRKKRAEEAMKKESPQKTEAPK